MAKKPKPNTDRNKGKQHMTTSVGNSPNTRFKNKHDRRSKKKYRGQGK